jgi:hypothetical protein
MIVHIYSCMYIIEFQSNKCATVNLHDRGYGSLKILDSDAVNINSVLELSVP